MSLGTCQEMDDRGVAGGGGGGGSRRGGRGGGEGGFAGVFGDMPEEG